MKVVGYVLVCPSYSFTHHNAKMLEVMDTKIECDVAIQIHDSHCMSAARIFTVYDGE